MALIASMCLPSQSQVSGGALGLYTRTWINKAIGQVSAPLCKEQEEQCQSPPTGHLCMFMPQTVINGRHEDMTPICDTCAYSPVPCISIGNRQRIPELAPAPPEHIYFDYLLSCISSLKYYFLSLLPLLDSVTEEHGQESSEREWKDTQQRASCWTL